MGRKRKEREGSAEMRTSENPRAQGAESEITTSARGRQAIYDRAASWFHVNGSAPGIPTYVRNWIGDGHGTLTVKSRPPEP